LMMISLSILILGLFYFLVKDKIFALIWVALAGFSHAYVYASLIGLNTNPMYLFLPLMLIFWVRGNLGWAIFCWSLFFSFEAIVGIILMPLILELLFWRRKTAWQRKLVFFGFLPLMPSLLFEIRHGFGQLKTIWRLVVLRESSLTDLPDSSFWLRLGERGKAFLDSFVYVGGQSRLL